MKRKLCFVATIEFVINVFMLGHLKALSEEYDLIVVTNTDNDKFLENQGIRAKVIKIEFERKINLIKDFFCLIKLYEVLKNERVDIVHSIMPKTGLLTALTGYSAHIPIRIHMFTGQVWANKRGIRRKVLKLLDRFISVLTTNVLVDGNSQLKFLIDEGVVGKEKATVLGEGSISGVDLKRFKREDEIKYKLKKEYSILDKDVVFGFLGRINKEKGIEDLVTAFSRMKSNKISLVVIGPLEDNEILYKFSSDVIFLGYKNNPEYYLNMIDVLCLPSYREGFGSVVLEAAAMEIPAIVSDIYGLQDSVIDDTTGLFFEVGNTNDLADKMMYLAENKTKIIEMGKTGRDRVENKFTSAKLTDYLLDFYRKL